MVSVRTIAIARTLRVVVGSVGERRGAVGERAGGAKMCTRPSGTGERPTKNVRSRGRHGVPVRV